MSELVKQDNSELKVQAGQQPVLDDRKRQRVFGMIAMGSSRREAAKAVGSEPVIAK